eukprot:3719973-Amphidinium_carterae.1
MDERSEAKSSSSVVTTLAAARASLWGWSERWQGPSGASARVPSALRKALTDRRAAFVACRTLSTAAV